MCLTRDSLIVNRVKLIRDRINEANDYSLKVNFWNKMLFNTQMQRYPTDIVTSKKYDTLILFHNVTAANKNFNTHRQ